MNLDDGCYYDEINIREERSDEELMSFAELNKGLKKDGLYIARFIATLPPYENNSGEWIIGSGDVYSDRDIGIDELGELKEISISA